MISLFTEQGPRSSSARSSFLLATPRRGCSWHWRPSGWAMSPARLARSSSVMSVTMGKEDRPRPDTDPDGRFDLPRRLPAHVQPDRDPRSNSAGVPPSLPGVLCFRRAGGRQLDDAAKRHAGGTDPGHRGLPADLMAARRPAAVVGLASAVLAEHRRRGDWLFYPAHPGGDTGLSRGEAA